MTLALAGARIFDGERMLDRHTVVLAGAHVAAVVPEADLEPGIETLRVEGLLAPGFIDVQVNGGGGVLFNDQPNVDGIRAIAAAHRRFGTTGFLPTFITDTRERMAEAMEAVRQGIAEGVPGLLGIHLEGPFINPARKGVHDAALIRPVEDEDIRIMTSLGAGRTVVTIAPEIVGPDVIERLTRAGVIVSAGHTAASYEVLAAARARGLRGYTHLFNAMPPLASREPGPVGAALDEEETWFSLIVDMHHVAEATLRVALSAKGEDRVMLITDAMPTVGTDVTRFELQGRTVLRKDGCLTIEDGTIAGSDLDMASAVRNMARKAGAPLPSALKMASLNPVAFLRLDGELGRLAPGYRASMVLLDGELNVKATWIDGIRG
ncbi:MAG: N-acetylglucosamine-6-phosphate deacetylase [Propylenella sp.]